MDYLIEKGVKVDAVITDPPYAITNFSWDVVIPFDKMWERLNKLIKPNGAIVLFGNEPFSSKLRMSNEELYKYDWKWIKTQTTGFQNSKNQPLKCYEDIMVFSKGGVSSNSLTPMSYYPQGLINVNIKMKKAPTDYLQDKKNIKVEKKEYIKEKSNFPRNVIQFPRPNNNLHPTQKPKELMEYLILTYTKPNELVLDFTSGSGSTLVSCEVLNRKWIGIELTDLYCDVIKKRIQRGIQLKLLLNYNKEE